MFRWFVSQPVGRDHRAVWFPNRRKSSMSKLSLKAVAGLVLVLAGITWLTPVRQAEARPQYLPVWLKTYPDVAEKNKVTAAVKCNVCHFGAKKSNRNDYGKAIIKALDGKKNVKDKDKIVDVLKAAAKEKNADGKTFGELLEANELPATKEK
jgi:hypothetical protein